MAHHASALKRVRQTKRRTKVNRARMARVRTFIGRVEAAIASGDQAQAMAAFKVMQPELMRGARSGVVHRNLVARKLSRLSARIKAMTR